MQVRQYPLGVAVDRKGLSPVMVGRSAKLRRLTTLLTSGPVSTSTGPEVALIAGEAGIGKSRMIAELLSNRPARTSMLMGRAGQGAPGRPYSVLLDALEPMVAGWTSLPAQLAARAESTALLLQPIAPGLDECRERQYGPDELQRSAVDLIRLLAPSPALVIFEDLHGADPESISLFGRLALTPDLHNLLVGTYRPEDLGRGHPLTALITDLERRRSITHVILERLSRASVGELLAAVYGRPVSWHVADTVHRRTGGNPFFIEELLLAAGESDPERLTTLPLPWNLSEVVLRHLDGLSEEERRVVDAAAVLGSRFPFDVLAAVVGVEEEHLIPVLRCLVSAGLLVEEEEDVFSFRHALTREAVAAQLLGRERRRLHERALTVLCDLGSDDYTALAHHAQGAGKYDQVVDFARRGAAEFLRMGHTHQALRLAELGVAEDGNDLTLRTLASRAAWAVGLLDVSRSHGETWRRLAGWNGDLSSEGAALRHLARVEWEAGNASKQRSYAESAFALAETHGPSEDLAHAMALMSEVYMLSQDRLPNPDEVGEAIRWADRALELAEQLDCPNVRPRALVSKGTALADHPETSEEGMRLLEQARAEAVALGDAWNQVRAINNMFGCGMLRWPPERVRAGLEEIRQVAWRTGREGQTMTMWANQAAQLAQLVGDMEEARQHLTTGRLLDPQAGDGLDHWWYELQELELDIEAAEWEPAVRLLERLGKGLVERPPLDIWSALRYDALAAEYEALRGDPDRAVSLLVDAVASRDNYRHHENRDIVLQAAITLVRGGSDHASVRRLLDQIDQQWPARTDDLPARRRHLEGALFEVEGQLDAAKGAYQAALADPLGYRPVPLAADVEQGMARCLLVTGDVEGARQAADRAVRLLAKWPGWRASQAAALARRLHPMATAPSDGLLTNREREVAALLAEGLTNGQIAQRLYISTKTASVHVSNILAKLGMASRAEVAAWAVREDLTA
jgi:DNA-binding CsgD family transcriptional regulator